MSVEPATLDRSSDAASWAMLAGLCMANVLFQWRAPLPLELTGSWPFVLACAMLAGAALVYSTLRPRPQFAVMCLGLMQVILFSALGAVLSYLLARNGGALWDAEFRTWDRALGFDWLAYVRWVDAHGWMVLPLRIAYASLIPQMVVIVLVLGFTLRVAELRATLLAAIVCGTITVLLSPLFPALSNYVALGLTAEDFNHVRPWAGYVHLADFHALREGSMAAIQLSKMEGIITFPSYHAGLAAVMLWSFWRSSIRWLRWGGSALATLTIVATPIDGGHYLVDVLAGIAIAAVSIPIATRAVAWAPALPSLMAWPFLRSRAASAR